MLDRVKMDNTHRTCNQGNFNQIRARSRNRTLVTVVRRRALPVPAAPPHEFDVLSVNVLTSH